MRQEDENSTDTFDNTVDEQRLERTFGETGGYKSRGVPLEPIDQIRCRPRNPEYSLKQKDHEQHEHNRTHDSMREHTIKFVA